MTHQRRNAVARLACVVVALVLPAAAGAASVAYVDNGEVWLSSLDGAQKARLAAPVVNADGDTETWLDVAQSDGGRIVAVRNKPGRMSNFSWFKVWEPDGSSTIEGALNAPSGWTIYAYPLGFDITADGKHLVYGYSNSGACCPISFGRGVYVRLVASGTTPPIDIASQTHPSLFGSRIIGLDDTSSPSIASVQDTDPGNPYTSTFTPWLDTSGVGLELNRVDVAADGRLAAMEFQAWNSGTQTTGKIGVLSIQGVDQSPTFPAAVDCFLPAAGIARDASLSQDSGMIAWRDDGGLKVAASPTTAADPCALGSTPVVLSPTGAHPSIGGANVAAFLPPPQPPPGPQPGSGTTGPTPGPQPGSGTTGTTSGPLTGSGTTSTTPGPPALAAGLRLAVRALARRRGTAIPVQVGGPGPVSIVGMVSAGRRGNAIVSTVSAGRRGNAIVVATGRATAAAAGTIRVPLRLTRAGRRARARLRGARMVLRVTQGGRSSRAVVTLR